SLMVPTSGRAHSNHLPPGPGGRPGTAAAERDGGNPHQRRARDSELNELGLRGSEERVACLSLLSPRLQATIRQSCMTNEKWLPQYRDLGGVQPNRRRWAS